MSPTVIFGALYNGYLYGLSFLFNGAFSVVFGPSGHGLDTLQVGLCFLGIIVGISCGPFTNIWQEKHFQHRRMQNGQRNVPEARVQLGKVAAIGMTINTSESLVSIWSQSLIYVFRATQSSLSHFSGSPGNNTILCSGMQY